MKVMLVDDDEEALAPLRDEMEERADIECRQVRFESVEEAISTFSPDLIVLDLFAGDPSIGSEIGRDRLEQIWESYFRPVVIYSADPSVVSESKYHEHPFICHIKKGSNSELRVMEAIDEFSPLIDVLQRARTRIDQEFSRALREVSPYAPAGSQRLRVVERAARRRIAALVDEAETGSDPIEPWEQYVFPPVSQNLRQGDILRCREHLDEQAKYYRVVLTPSCDLVAIADRSPKVDAILVARCISMKRAMASIAIDGNPSKKRSRLRRVLNSGFERHIVPLPALPNLIPMMAADLRSLELIPIGRVADDYAVMASVDSPFREAIAWAYMQSGARPGLPDRATKSWAAEAVASLSSEEGV